MIRAARTTRDDKGQGSVPGAANELLLPRLARTRHIAFLPLLEAHRAGACGPADIGLGPPFQETPGSNRAGLDPDDWQCLRLVDQEGKRRDIPADPPRATSLDDPAERDEGSLERSRELPGELEGEVLPVGLLEGFQLGIHGEHFLVEPDRHPAVADVSVRRPAEQTLPADQLGGNVYPCRSATNAHGDRATIAPFAAPLDAALDMTAAPRLGRIER